jgi:hypothetical protein
MAITTTIFVYFTTDSANRKIIEYFPNNDVHVPPKTIATVVYNAIPSPSGFPAPEFIVNSIVATGTNQNRVTFGSKTTAQFTANVDNTDMSVADAGVSFSVVNPAGPTQPVLNGGGTIRNKGTSISTIFARYAMVGFASLAIGVLLGEILHPHIAALLGRTP